MSSASKAHVFQSAVSLFIGLFLFVAVLAPTDANAGFFDSFFGVQSSPKASPKTRVATQKPKSPKPQVAKKKSEPLLANLKLDWPSLPKIDLPELAMPKLRLGATLASVGDALWPFDDVKKSTKSTKTVASEKKSKQDKQSKPVAQVLGEKDSKGPGFLSKFFKGIGNAIAGIFDFLWPFDDKKGLAKKDQGTGIKLTQASPSPAATPSPEDEVVTELAQAGDEDSSTAVVATTFPGEVAKLTITEKLTVGDDSADRLILKALLGSDILVDESKKYDLGSGGGRFRSGYFSDNLYVGEENRIGATGMNVKGSAYIETRSGGSIYLLPDSQNVYIGTDDKTGHLTVANNLTVKGTLSTTSGASLTPDSLDITPATNIDALDIIGTNITTASLIDLDPTGTTSGNIIDIDMSTAFSGAVISLDQTAGAATGDVISYDNSANTATTGDFLSFASGTGDADGDVMDITVELGATSTQIFDINNAAVSDEAGWLMEVDTTGAWTGNAIDFTTGAQAWTGNVLDINFGNAAATGDVINIDNPALAVATQALVVTNAAASSTAGWLASVDASGAWTANAINFIQSAGISTGDVIAYDNTGNTAITGDYISFASGTGDADGDVMDITVELGATSTQIFDINNAAVSDEAGWLMEVDTTGAWTGNMVDITTGAQAWTGNIFAVTVGAAASTGDVFNVDMGASNIAGGAFVVAAAGGARSDAIIDITTASTGSAADAAAIFQINASGALNASANVIDLNLSGGAASNAIDITTSGTAFTGNVLDINFGNIADTGDAINISHGASAVGIQALVAAFTAGGITTTDGIVDLDVTAGNAAVDVVNIALTVNDGATAGTDMTASEILLTANDADADVFGITITAASTANAGSGTYEAGIFIDNADTTAGSMNDGILITSSGVSVGVTDAIDVSATNIDNAINAGLNDILLSTLQMNESGTNVWTVEETGGTDIYNGTITTIQMNLSAQIGGTAQRLCHGGADASAGLETVGDCGATQADLAEWYGVSDDSSEGDVVVLDGVSTVVQTDQGPATAANVRKSSSPYQGKVIGVVSTNPSGEVLGDMIKPHLNNPKAVALVGRVPVKVTNEGGPIVAGDYLTTSSTPGHTMKAIKAGPVVGMAISDFSGDKGTVVAFVKAVYYDPIAAQKAAVLAALGMGSYQPVYGQVLGTTTAEDSTSTGTATGGTATNSLIGPAADGSLGVLAEEVDLLVHGLLTATNLRVTTAAEFEGTLLVKGLATFEGDLVVKGALSLGALDIAGALTKTMTAGSDISAGDPVVVTGANTVSRAGGPGANVVGLAAHSAGAGSAVRVAVAGTVGGYSGLSTGSRYYVGSGGVVTTAPGGENAVHVGIAISGSEMIVQIFATSVPAEPVVEDIATVDPGPTVTVPENTGGTSQPEEQTSTVTPSPSPEPSPSPSPAVEGASTQASPTPSPIPSPYPSPTL